MILPEYLVAIQSIVPVVRNGWRTLQKTPVMLKEFFTFDDAIEYAIAAYVDTVAESHRAVIKHKGKTIRRLSYGDPFRAFSRGTKV